MKSRLIRMTEGKPGKLILQFALPLMLGSIFQQTYTIVDTAVVGQVVGVDGLAALGAADWFNWLSLGICTGLAQGFSILIAQFFGAKDEFRLKKAVAMSFLLTLAAAVILTAIFQIAAGPVLHLMGTDPSIMEGSMTYVRICFSGICVVLSYNVLAAILRAIGDSTTPLVAMVIAAAINVGLDLLFVAGFGWGIAGAASATVIGQFFSAVYCLIRLSRMEVMRLKRVHWKPDKTILTRLLTLSGPLAFQSTVIAVGGMILQSIVNTFGVIFVAVFTATNKLYGLLELAAISFGHAVSTYTGQNLGARNYQRIKMGVRAGAKMAVLTALVTSAVMIVFGRFFISLFVDAGNADADAVMTYAYHFLFTMSVFLFILYLLYIFRSALQGMGNTGIPMVSGIAELVMRIGSALLLPHVIGEYGIYMAEVLAWAGATALLVICYFRTERRFPKEGESQHLLD